MCGPGLLMIVLRDTARRALGILQQRGVPQGGVGIEPGRHFVVTQRQ